MGCGGSEEKGDAKVEVVEDSEAPAAADAQWTPGDTHISLHLKCGLKEGKTMVDLQTLYGKEVEVVMKQEGCLMFQIDMTEDSLGTKTAILTEKYASAEAHLATNVALAEAGLVEGADGIFATYDFVEMKFGLPAKEHTEGYKELLEGFEKATGNKPIVTVHEFGGWVNKTGENAARPLQCDYIIMTATVGLAEGKTLDDMKKLYAKEVEVAKKTPGCLHFQLEMNEDAAGSKTAVLHEVYTDAAGHLELNKNLDEAGLVQGPDGIFSTYKFTEFVFGMCSTPITEDYQGLLNQFKEATGVDPVIHEHTCSGKIKKFGGR